MAPIGLGLPLPHTCVMTAPPWEAVQLPLVHTERQFSLLICITLAVAITKQGLAVGSTGHVTPSIEVPLSLPDISMSRTNLFVVDTLIALEDPFSI